MDLGMLNHARVFPLVWNVLPGQEKGDHGRWDCIETFCERLVPHIGETACMIIGESAFGCFPMVPHCQKEGWGSLCRLCGHHTCQQDGPDHALVPSCAVATWVSQPGKRLYGAVRLWHSMETHLSAYWAAEEEEALLVISDKPAGAVRLKEYRGRWRVEATFHHGKRRGWDWESSHVRRLDRIDRMLLVLFLAVWWLVHLAASWMHHGRRDRSDRQDRRDTSILRMGRRSLLAIARKSSRLCDLTQGVLFRGVPTKWRVSLRF